MSISLLLGEALAGRPARKQIDIFAVAKARERSKILSGHLSDIRLEDSGIYVPTISLNGRTVPVEGGSHIELGSHETETQAASSAESIDATQFWNTRAPLHFRGFTSFSLCA